MSLVEGSSPSTSAEWLCTLATYALALGQDHHQTTPEPNGQQAAADNAFVESNIRVEAEASDENAAKDDDPDDENYETADEGSTNEDGDELDEQDENVASDEEHPSLDQWPTPFEAASATREREANHSLMMQGFSGQPRTVPYSPAAQPSTAAPCLGITPLLTARNIDFRMHAKLLPDTAVRLIISQAVDNAGKPPGCPVCMESNGNPLILTCGHVVCRECIRSMFDGGIGRCGMCREQIKWGRWTDWESLPGSTHLDILRRCMR